MNTLFALILAIGLEIAFCQDTDPYALLNDFNIDANATCSLTNNIPLKVLI